MSGAPGERLRVRLVVLPLDVQRLGAVRECVQRRSAGLAGRQVVRELRLVDDARDVRSRAAALHAAGLVADPEAARPLGPGVGRGDGDDRKARGRRNRLGRVDRAAAADRKQAVGALGRGGRLGDRLGRAV